MVTSPERAPLQLPKLRPLDARWVGDGRQHYLFLRDPLGLSPDGMMVPGPLAPLLALCDGTRTVETLRTGFLLRTGITLGSAEIEAFLRRLDDALFLEGERVERAKVEALERYRQAPYRSPALAGSVYPSEPGALQKTLQEFCHQAAGDEAGRLTPTGCLVGIISPHIDYQRGHRVYARVWTKAAPALETADLVVVFGTDHTGGPGRLTLTRQHYATPWGVLPTETAVVQALADALGTETVFSEELHHRGEHSIELAIVWLRHALGGRTVPIVPILCGHFGPYIVGDQDPVEAGPIERALTTLREVTKGQRVVVVAAADFAHVGPAFGDPVPLDLAARARLAAADKRLLASVCQGDATGFLQELRAERDQRKVCGLPPIYLALQFLGPDLRGELVDYDQCPADPQGGSLVSIAGVLLYNGAASAPA